MIRNSGPHFEKSLDQPINGPPHFFTPDIELPDHMQEFVGQNPHLQQSLVGFKPLATGTKPMPTYRPRTGG
jgi:hypothetical protein